MQKYVFGNFEKGPETHRKWCRFEIEMALLENDRRCTKGNHNSHLNNEDYHFFAEEALICLFFCFCFPRERLFQTSGRGMFGEGLFENR